MRINGNSYAAYALYKDASTKSVRNSMIRMSEDESLVQSPVTVKISEATMRKLHEASLRDSIQSENQTSPVDEKVD